MYADTKTILVRARELIAEPSHWTQYAQAKDILGNNVSPYSRTAVSFCALGALKRAEYDADSLTGAVPRECDKASLYRHLPSEYSTLMNFNDSCTHTEVLDLFDAAIRSL